MFRQTTNQNQNPFRAVTSPNGISDLLIQTFIWEVCDSRKRLKFTLQYDSLKSLLFLFLISMAVIIELYAYAQQHAKSNE